MSTPGGPTETRQMEDLKRQDYFLRRIDQALERGREAEAAALLERLGPPAGSADLARRLRRWIVRAPGLAVMALAGAGRDLCDDPEVAAVVAGVVLALPAAAWEAIERTGASFVADALRVRRAAALISGGDDAGALEELRPVGLRSPFRNAKLFLRGLCAYYRGEDEEAVRALSALEAGGPYPPLASPTCS
jgi:hypothetical protein